MNFKHILILASALAVLAGCKKSEEAEADKISLKPATVAVSGAGETKTLSVSSNGDWKASVDKEWVHVAPLSGNAATKSITVLVDENTTGAERSAVITVTCGSAKSEATISQSADAVEEGTIANAEDFLAFVSEGAAVATEADEFNISADIDLGGAEIAPIPVFAGVLDGNNHKVYNFKVVSKEATSGLILTNNGVVKNLILGSSDGTSYDGKSEVGFDSEVTTLNHIGGVCAVNAGTIENVKQFAKIVTKVGNTALTGIGGLVGAINSPATVKDCENHANIEASGITAGETYIGGVVAYVNNAEALIDHCVNTVPVEVTIGINKASMFAGVVARANAGAKVQDCENRAPVKYVWSDQGQSGNYIMVAGVVGALYTGSSALRCVNKAAVSSTNQQVTRMGGIVGTLNSKGLVEDCVNEGEVNLTVANPNVNWQSVAGIVGFQEKQNSENIIRNNINKADVNVSVNIAGTHGSNRVHAGGILGLGNLGVEVYGNKNQGNITASNSSTGAGNAIQIEAGGIVGGIRGEGSYTKDNENSGKVSCTAGDYAFTGGVVGHLGTLNGDASDAGLTMTNDKNTGAVVGSDATKTGSVAGVSTATLTECTAAGSVNGVTLTDANFVQLAVGTSTGKIVDLKSPSGSTASSKELAVSPAENRVDADAVSASFTVASNTSWTVSTTADWITSYTTSGTNDGTIEIAFAAYTSMEADREAEFTVTGEGVEAPVVVKLIQSKVLDSAPHNIPSLDELKLLAQEVKKETPSFARWQDGEGVINIVADIDASTADFLPIEKIPAGIVINGNNHTITLALNADAQYVSIFKTVAGTLKNIIVAGSVKSVLSTGAEHFVCGLVCTLDGGLVNNCVNNASITASGKVTADYSKYSYASGLVGVFKTDGAAITNCTNNGNIVVDGDNISMASGIVAYGQPANECTLTIENCHNHGNITLEKAWTSIPNKWGYCGGVVSKMGSTAATFKTYSIKDCSSDGNININKSEKIRCGGIFGNAGNSADYAVTGCSFSGTVTVNSTEAVDRIVGGIGPGFSEANAIGTVSNSVFSGKIIAAQTGGNMYFGGIYGNNGNANVVIDGCKTTAASVIDGGTVPKSIAMIAARPNAANFTVKNCKIAGKINAFTPKVDETPASYGELMTITAENIADWMWKGTGTTVAVTLTDNGFNAE